MSQPTEGQPITASQIMARGKCEKKVGFEWPVVSLFAVIIWHSMAEAVSCCVPARYRTIQIHLTTITNNSNTFLKKKFESESVQIEFKFIQ